MKKAILPLILVFINCTLLFAQEIKPVAKGVITLTTGQKNEFIDLRFEKPRVFFTNVATKSVFIYLIDNVQLIEDGEHNIVYDKVKSSPQKLNDPLSKDSLIAKKQAQQLRFVNAYKILQNEQKLSPDAVRGIISTNSLALDEYNTGRVLVTLGDIALGGGLGMFIGRGISNLNKANNTQPVSFPSQEKAEPPVFMITSLVIACIGIPLKIIGRDHVKSSIQTYNQNPKALSKSKDANLVLFTKNNSVGLCYNF